MTVDISSEERLRRQEIRDTIMNYNLIDPYADYNAGELENMKRKIYRLQHTVEALIVVLASKNGLDLNDFMNEA